MQRYILLSGNDFTRFLLRRLRAAKSGCFPDAVVCIYFFIFGSSASRSPSPNRLNDRIIRLISAAGKMTRYG